MKRLVLWSLAALVTTSSSAFAEGFLGIVGQTVEDGKGVTVERVMPDSPADKAKLRQGDVILGVGETDVADYEALAEAIAEHKPGDELSFRIRRDDEELTIQATLAKAPPEPTRPSPPDPPQAPGAGPVPEQFRHLLPEGFQPFAQQGNRPLLGVHLQPIDDELRQRLELGEENGALISHVLEGSPAEKAGLKTEDLITKADETDIDDPQALVGLIRDKKAGDEVTLTIRRGDETLEKTVKLEPFQRQDVGQQFPGFPDVDPRQFPQVFPGAVLNVTEMQQRIDALEQKVEELSRQLETLKSRDEATPERKAKDVIDKPSKKAKEKDEKPSKKVGEESTEKVKD